ncbi:MAG: InlB B-repeat-containing protein, partial [Ruminococcus sp.]|nr:InlB B-repeat-containing protein [Ruminococcus sp.]
GSVISTQTVEEGKSATAPANPVRESTAMYSYTFKGWDKTFSNITADTKVTAQYNQTINKYTVTFKDYDGKVLSTQVVEAGTAATAPADPVRENTDQYTYEFVGWDKNFSSVTKDMEVNAVYTQTLKTYVVTFVGFGGEELSVQDVEHGGSAMDPYVPDVDGYVFVGWDKSLDDIVEDTVITAIYNRIELPRYTVTFKDWDGTVLSTQSVEEGESAVAPETPVREADSKYTYTFKRWDKTFSGVTQDLVVTAVYTQTLNKFTVIFKDFDGKELSSQTVEYGASAVAPADPEREGYKFTGWDTEFDNITADTVVTANYTKVIVAPTTGKLRIEVSGGTGFKISVNGGSLRPQGTYYNNTKTPIGASVTVVANMVDGVEFLGWMNESGAVVSASDTYNFIASGNDYLQAVYMTPVEDVNVVLFKNAKAAGGNGQLLDMQYYAAGDVVDFPDAPAQTGYVFTGWSMTPDVIQAKLSAGEDVIVTATWELAKIYIDVTVKGGTITTTPQANGKYLAFNALTV